MHQDELAKKLSGIHVKELMPKLNPSCRMGEFGLINWTAFVAHHVIGPPMSEEQFFSMGWEVQSRCVGVSKWLSGSQRDIAPGIQIGRRRWHSREWCEDHAPDVLTRRARDELKQRQRRDDVWSGVEGRGAGTSGADDSRADGFAAGPDGIDHGDREEDDRDGGASSQGDPERDGDGNEFESEPGSFELVLTGPNGKEQRLVIPVGEYGWELTLRFTR